MNCPRCAGQVDDTASFCPTCGNDLRAEGAPDQGATGDTQVPAATPASAPAPQPASNNRNGCIIAACLVALFLCVIVSCGTLFLGTTVLTAIPFWSAITQMPDGTSGSDGLDATSPQTAVDDWYGAVADGDLDAAKGLSTSEFGATIDKDQFDGPQNFDHTITSTITRNDESTVIVSQTSPDVSGSVTLTFKLKKQSDGDWLISAVDVTSNDPTD